MQTLSNVCNRAYMEVVLQYEDMMCLSWYKYIWNDPLSPPPSPSHLMGTETVQAHIMQPGSRRKDKVGIIWIAVQVNGCLCYDDKYICDRAQERFS